MKKKKKKNSLEKAEEITEALAKEKAPHYSTATRIEKLNFVLDSALDYLCESIPAGVVNNSAAMITVVERTMITLDNLSRTHDISDNGIVIAYEFELPKIDRDVVDLELN